MARTLNGSPVMLFHKDFPLLGLKDAFGQMPFLSFT